MVELAFDLGDMRVAEVFPILLTHREVAHWGYVRATAQECVDEIIVSTYRALYDSSVVEGSDRPGDDD